MRIKASVLGVFSAALLILLGLQWVGRQPRYISFMGKVSHPDPVHAQRLTYRANICGVSWRHGWPLVFAERYVPLHVFPGEEPWEAQSWAFWGGEVSWHPAAFVLDFGLFVSIAFVIAVGWITWLRQIVRTYAGSTDLAMDRPIEMCQQGHRPSRA